MDSALMKEYYENTPTATLRDIAMRYNQPLATIQELAEDWSKITSLTTTNDTHAIIELDIDSMKKNIGECKTLALHHCLSWMRTSAEHAEIRELKDVVNIVATIEDSLSDTNDTSGNVNILISTLGDRLVDDC
jgi:hypothetical protein